MAQHLAGKTGPDPIILEIPSDTRSSLTIPFTNLKSDATVMITATVRTLREAIRLACDTRAAGTSRIFPSTAFMDRDNSDTEASDDLVSDLLQTTVDASKVMSD